MNLVPDPWLQDILGYPVFKVSLSPVDEEGGEVVVLRDTLHAAAEGGPAFFYAKIPTARIDQVQALSEAGFCVVDVNVTFERLPADPSRSTKTQGIVVREASQDEHESVQAIAEDCFVYSRFHLDPQIPNLQANAVKRAWIESYCRKQRGERLMVADLEGRVVGFNAILTTTEDGKTVRVIDLIGVDRAYRGRRVGGGLVEHFIHDSFGRASLVRVGTQAANIPSLRLYEKYGFQVAATAYVLHVHLPGNEARA